MAILYRIKDWDRSFENSDTRKLKHLAWTPVTTKLAGKSYSRIVAHPRVCEILAAFEAMRKVAANAPRRGYLEDHDGPLDAGDLAAITRLPAAAFDIAFRVLVEEKTAWLEAVEREILPVPVPVSGESPDVSGESPDITEMPGESPDASGAAPEGSRLQDKTLQDRTSIQPTARAKAMGLVLPKEPEEQVRVLLGATLVGSHAFEWGVAANAGAAKATVTRMVSEAKGDVDAVTLALHGLYLQGPPGKSFKATTQISELLFWREKREENAAFEAKKAHPKHKPETFERDGYATGRLG